MDGIRNAAERFALDPALGGGGEQFPGLRILRQKVCPAQVNVIGCLDESLQRGPGAGRVRHAQRAGVRRSGTGR